MRTKNNEQNADDIDIDVIPIHTVFSILDIPRETTRKQLQTACSTRPFAFLRVPFILFLTIACTGKS